MNRGEFDFQKQIVSQRIVSTTTIQELAHRLGIPDQQAVSSVASLVQQGRLRQVTTGIYASTPAGNQWAGGYKWGRA